MLKFIYKRIVEIFFLFYYGYIKEFKDYKNILLKKIKIKKNFYKIYEIKNCRVYTNTNDVAYIDDNKIIRYISIQIRNGKFDNVSSNIVVKKGTPKFYRYYDNRVFSLLCGAHGNSNYFHWFFDVLPRFFLYKKIYKFTKKDFFLVPSFKKNFQRESLKFLGVKNIIQADKLNHIKAKIIIATFYDTFLKHNENPPYWLIQDLKKNFNRIKKSNKVFIYIDRINLNDSRTIVNDQALKKFLLSKRFEIIDTAQLTFKEEIKKFSNAKIIIGLYGAGLTNVIFCKSKANIIEISNKLSGNLYANIIKKAGHNYYRLNSKKLKNNNNLRKFDGSFFVDLDKLEKILKKII